MLMWIINFYVLGSILLAIIPQYMQKQKKKFQISFFNFLKFINMEEHAVRIGEG